MLGGAGAQFDINGEGRLLSFADVVRGKCLATEEKVPNEGEGVRRKRRLVISMQADETILENGGLTSNFLMIPSWVASGIKIAGRSSSSWEDGCTAIKVEIKG